MSLSGEPAEELWFVDPRTFGEVVVFDPDHIDVELPELAQMGIDPLRDGLDAITLQALLAGRRTRLKPLLLDQHVIAGIGNIYADEILHGARLHPDRVAGSLRRKEVVALHDVMHDVLEAAVGAGGSTLGDNQYVDLMGGGGSYQDDHRVYGRAGEHCLTCGRGVIRRTVSAGRSTHYCSWCQRLPRRLCASLEDLAPSLARAPDAPHRRCCGQGVEELWKQVVGGVSRRVHAFWAGIVRQIRRSGRRIVPASADGLPRPDRRVGTNRAQFAGGAAAGPVGPPGALPPQELLEPPGRSADGQRIRRTSARRRQEPAALRRTGRGAA